MRGPQLRRIVGPHLPAGIETQVQVLPSPRHPRLQALWARLQPAGTIYLVTKPAIRRLLPETAVLLRRKGARLAFDYVDSDPWGLPVAPDAHIAASYSQTRALQAWQAGGEVSSGPVLTLLHNGDARLYGRTNPPPPRDGFRAVYFGLPELTAIPARLAPDIDIFSADRLDPRPGALDPLFDYALHYGVRTDLDTPTRIVKPFTKGFTAALCGANILTGRAVPDAMDVLGADYPYLTGPSEGDIIETFTRARADFGGPDWQRALQATHAAAALVSPQALALSLARVVAALDG